MIGYLARNGNEVAVLAGAGAGVCFFLAAVIRGLWVRALPVTPREDRALRIKAHPVAAGRFAPDLAWPLYPFRQAAADKRAVRACLGQFYGRLWRWPRDTFLRGRHGPRPLWWILLLVAWPFSIAICYLLLACGLAAWLSYGVYWLVVTACCAVYLAIHAVAAACLRAAQALRRTAHRAQAACTACFHVTPWPAYRCPGCGDLHHDIRPGRLGVFTRRCECGAHLPASTSRAAWRLPPACQRCERPLPPGTGAVRDVRIPVFGDKSAGKTRFLYASLNSLMHAASQSGIAIEFPDAQSRDKADTGLSLILSGRDTDSTRLTDEPALTVRLGRRDLVHLFDAAGTRYRDATQYEDLKFVEHGHGLVYVLDPFSVSGIRERLDHLDPDVVTRAHAAEGDPETAYVEVTSRLRNSGVPARGQRLAVVVSKADLLRAAGLDPPAESAALAEWLSAHGLHNIVLSARRDFADARFFPAASLDVSAAGTACDPGTPLRWLLTAHGMRPPGAGPGGSRDPRATESAESADPTEARS